MHATRGCRFAFVAALAACVLTTISSATTTLMDSTHSVSAADDGDVDLRQQLRTLGRQVTVLLERRREDLQSIEEHMRRKLIKS